MRLWRNKKGRDEQNVCVTRFTWSLSFWQSATSSLDFIFYFSKLARLCEFPPNSYLSVYGVLEDNNVNSDTLGGIKDCKGRT